MFHLSQQWLLLALDVSIKSLLLAAAAFVLLRLFKIRNSSVRHRVWSGVLLGMLTLPILSRVVPPVPLPISIQPPWIDALNTLEPEMETLVASASTTIETNADSPPGLAPSFFVDSQPSDNHTDVFGATLPQSAADSALATDSELRAFAEIDSATTDPLGLAEAPDTTTSAAATSLLARFAHRIPATIAVVWLAGISLMVLRLLLGIMAAARIVRRTTDVKSMVHMTLGDASERLPKSHGARLRESSDVHVPMTFGLLRPTILLPAEWQHWSREKLQAVLTHELTHVERSDFVVALLAEVNRCLYWFHPLSWWLRNRLSDLAEEACDDAAIDLTGDPTGYARHLLEVATTISGKRGRVIEPGLSMARQSNVEGRINTILDFTRPLSQRLTWKATSLIVVLTVPVIGVAAALRPTGELPPTENLLDTPITAEQKLPGVPQAVGTDEVNATKLEAPLQLAGQVLDPEGRPVSGAKLYLTRMNWIADSFPKKPVATSDADGRFEVAVTPDDCDSYTSVLAVAEGFGFAMENAVAFDASGQLRKTAPDYQRDAFAKKWASASSVLSLSADDRPIQGRVLNTEGRPVSGARIEILAVMAGATGNLDAWEQAASVKDANYQAVSGHLKQLISGPATNLTATSSLSDENGNFRIRGIGRDRIATIAILGPGIASHRVHVRTKSGETLRVANLQSPDPKMGDDTGRTVYEPAEFTYVAAATQPVVGRITDRATGQPIAACDIHATRIATDPIPGVDRAGFIRTTTDASGAYRLEGLPIGTAQFTVVPPEGSDYIRIQNQVKISATQQPFERNISLVEGVRVRGQVTDVQTGKPVPGYVETYVFRDNPLLQGKRRLRLPTLDKPWRPTDKQGRFEVVVVPGQSIVGFRANDFRNFPHGVGAENITGRKYEDVPGAYDTAPQFCMTGNFNYLVELNTERGQTADPIEIQVDSGHKIAVTVVDEDGEPTNGFRAFGQKEISFGWYKSAGNTLIVEGYRPEKPRRILVWKQDTNQIGTLLLKGPVPAVAPQVKLQPGGTIRGRLVDKQGKPLAGIRLDSSAHHRPSDGQQPDELVIGTFPGRNSIEPSDEYAQPGKLFTDEHGRFEIPGVCPGLRYSAMAVGPPSISHMFFATASNTGPMVRYGTISVFKHVVVGPGEIKDVGEVKCYPGRPKLPSPSTSAANAAEPSAVSTTSPSEVRLVKSSHRDLPITGTVTDTDGQPVRGAQITVRKVSDRKAYTLPRTSQVVSKYLTDARGQFELTVPPTAVPKEHSYDQWLTVQATASGYGLSAATVRDFDNATGMQLRLPQQTPIVGRVLHLEGQPVAGARIRVLEVTSAEDQKLDSWLVETQQEPTPSNKLSMLPSMWESSAASSKRFPTRERFDIPIETFAELSTDDSGGFTLDGIGHDHLVHLEVTGPKIEKTVISVLARSMEPIHGESATHLLAGGTRYFGANFNFVAAPSSPVTGVVRDAQTKKPLVGATVSVSSVAGSPMSRTGWLTTVTDDEGHYRIEGLPTAIKAKRYPNRLEVFTPNEPYLITAFTLPASTSSDGVQHDLELRRAVWAEGRLFNVVTGEPVQGFVFYAPFNGNPSNVDYAKYADNSRTLLGHTRHYRTGADGRFRLPVIPGRGILVAKCEQNLYQAAHGADEIKEFRKSQGTLGAPTSDYVAAETMNAVCEINAPSIASRIEIDLPVHPGQSMDLKFESADGNPLPEILVLGLRAIRAGSDRVTSGLGRATGLKPGERRTIYAHDEANRLAVLTEIIASDASSKQTIQLQPLVSVTGRLVNHDQQPVAQRGVSAFSVGLRAMQLTLPTKTDADGLFELELPAGGPCDIRVEKSRPESVIKNVKFSEPRVDLGVITLPDNEQAPGI